MSRLSIPMSLLYLVACDPQSMPAASAPAPASAIAAASGRAARAAAPAAAPAPAAARGPVLANARAVFDEVHKLVRERYVDADVAGDLLWTGAVEGMLRRLIQHKSVAVNEVMDAKRLDELKQSISGSISGVGLALVHAAGGVYVIDGAIPGTPAARADLRKGDRIIRVGDTSIGALSLREVVDLIRGPRDTEVRLLVQREEKTWPVTLVRRPIAIPDIEHEVLGPRVGYLSISAFHEPTVARLDAALRELQQKDATERLILDLRNCAGGLLPASLAAAERFLPQGARIATVRRRGGAEEHFVVKRDRPLVFKRIAVLTSAKTSSSAELLTAALREHRGATVLGERTAGKWTVEEILPLAGGAGLRLTIGLLLSSRGEHLQDRGVEPDIALVRTTEAPKATDKRSDDPQIKSALRVLGL